MTVIISVICQDEENEITLFFIYKYQKSKLLAGLNTGIQLAHLKMFSVIPTETDSIKLKDTPPTEIVKQCFW